MAKTITLDKDYGYSQYRVNRQDADIIDAYNASWIVDNWGSPSNKYPVFIDNGNKGLQVLGGTIEGRVPDDVLWNTLYYSNQGGNSAALNIKNTDNVVIRDWSIDKSFDAIRLQNTENFLIENVRITNVRDDAIEMDTGNGGIIRNSVFENVFVGISLGDQNSPQSGAQHTVTIENVLIRQTKYPFRAGSKTDPERDTHAYAIKTHSKNGQDLKIYDTVIAIEDPTHPYRNNMDVAWDNIVDAKNNYFLNLSDKPLPGDYALPPKAGFTILQGKEARDFYNSVRDDYWEAAMGGSAAIPDHDPEPNPEHDHNPDPQQKPNSVGDDDLLAINIGGGKYTAKDGTVFEADNTGVGVSKNLQNKEIAGTQDDVLYRTEAYSGGDQLNYSFDVADGTYEVNLHFAELWDKMHEDNGRYFDIFMEGQKVKNNLDIYKEVGGDSALIKTYMVDVKDGELNIDLHDNADNAKLSALTIKEVSSSNGPEPEPEQIVMEFGSVEANHNMVTVDLDHKFIDPVVLMTMTSFNGDQLAVPRITDIGGDSFTFYTQEADYFGGAHVTETFSYMVVEKGSWVLSDGTKLEAGYLETDKLSKDGFENVSFDTDFVSRPTVLTQVQTNNGTDFVDTRQKGIDSDGFEVAMQEQELYNDHTLENVGWLAIEQGVGSDDGHDFHAGSTSNSYTHEWKDIMFADDIDELPQLIANISSHDGGDSSFVRARGLDKNGVEVMIQEDASKDAEIRHTTETFDFFTIEGSGQLTAAAAEFM